jgi:pimeloyl-ACP methyl ester carboxylesterase
LHFPLKGHYFISPQGAMHYHDTGRGEPVLLLHGCGSLGEEILAPFARHKGFRWIAPDRLSYGFSNTIGHAQDHDPRAQALNLLRLLDWLQIDEFILVAHSLGSAVALWLAAHQPSRVRALVLLAPFCRPTPEASMPLLRLAVAPVIGAPIRHLAIPPLSGWIGRRQIRALLHPRPVPSWLDGFPCRHAASANGLKAAAGELRRFNHAMRRFQPVKSGVPTIAVFGDMDRTSKPSWHGRWLAAHLPRTRFVHLPNTGHAPHHSDPAAIMRFIRGLRISPDIISPDLISPDLGRPGDHQPEYGGNRAEGRKSEGEPKPEQLLVTFRQRRT